ncbi:hypothetical protein KCV00_g314, partial [Aureobasidium melanogenum]
MTASMASRYSSATTTPDVMARAVAGGSSVDMLEWVFIRLGGFCLVKVRTARRGLAYLDLAAKSVPFIGAAYNVHIAASINRFQGPFAYRDFSARSLRPYHFVPLEMSFQSIVRMIFEILHVIWQPLGGVLLCKFGILKLIAVEGGRSPEHFERFTPPLLSSFSTGHIPCDAVFLKSYHVAPSIANMYVEEEEQEVVDAILGLLRGLSVTSGIDASDIRLRYTSRSLSGTGALRFDLLAALRSHGVKCMRSVSVADEAVSTCKAFQQSYQLSSKLTGCHTIEKESPGNHAGTDTTASAAFPMIAKPHRGRQEASFKALTVYFQQKNGPSKATAANKELQRGMVGLR